MGHKVERDWEAHGMRCVVIAVDKGHRCGYVGVPVGHPLHGINYGESADCLSAPGPETAIGKRGIIPLFVASGNEERMRAPDVAFDVHGSLTFSGGGTDYPVESAGLWWFGFDAAHCGDAKDPELMSPKLRKFYAEWPNFGNEVVRTLDYMSTECESLAEQLAAVKGS